MIMWAVFIVFAFSWFCWKRITSWENMHMDAGWFASSSNYSHFGSGQINRDTGTIVQIHRIFLGHEPECCACAEPGWALKLLTLHGAAAGTTVGPCGATSGLWRRAAAATTFAKASLEKLAAEKSLLQDHRHQAESGQDEAVERGCVKRQLSMRCIHVQTLYISVWSPYLWRCGIVVSPNMELQVLAST